MPELGSPIRANFEITEACPLACKHCYAYWGFAATGHRVRRADEHYDLNHFRRILDVLLNHGVRVITFTGGEPFERKDVLFPLIKEAKSAGAIVFVNTSAALIAAEDIPIIRGLDADGFLVSLMSYDEQINNELSQSNSHDKTTRGIRLLAEARQNVSVNMVVSKRNCLQVRETAKLAYKLGAKSFSASPMMPALSYPGYLAMRLSESEMKQVMLDLMWVRENIPIIATSLESIPYCLFNRSEIRKYRPILSHSYCCAGMSDCAVSVRGDLRPCIMSSDSAGNILHDNWDEVWSSLKLWRSADLLPEECRQCAVVDECGGGCRVAANTMGGSYSARDPYMKAALHDPLEPPQVRKLSSNLRISGDDLLRISTDTKMRAEPFGGSLFIANKCIFLKPEPFKMLTELKTSDAFSLNRVSASYNCSYAELESFMQLLADESVVVRVQ